MHVTVREGWGRGLGLREWITFSFYKELAVAVGRQHVWRHRVSGCEQSRVALPPGVTPLLLSFKPPPEEQRVSEDLPPQHSRVGGPGF